MGYNSEVQSKNLAWFLPRPNKNKYKGGMPLYAENWLIDLAKDILDKQDIDLLNLFCGMNKCGFRIDMNPEVFPDILADAHDFVRFLPENKRVFDVILADPPYSDEESVDLYNINVHLDYNKWTSECAKILATGGLLIVYHKYIMPNPNPEIFYVEKRVFIGNRVRHLPRVAIYFRSKI